MGKPQDDDAGMAAAMALAGGESMAQDLALRILLNTSLSGPTSFFLLAEDKGYLREAGIRPTFYPGGGAALIVPQVRHGSFDVGYGDMSALIERIARGPAQAGPVAVYTTFNTVPFTIAVPAGSAIRSPKDLEGKRIIGHPVDAALITFDMFAEASGIDPRRVKVEKSSSSMGSQVAEMLAGTGADAVFGFVNTIIASVAPLGIEAAQLRFINYADVLPDMYGNTLFVTRELYRDRPELVRGLVRACNRALSDTVANPDQAIDALARRVPSFRRQVDHTRLLGTFKSEMAHPEGGRIGIGDMDDARLERLIALIVKAKALPRKPTIREVF